MMKEPEEQPPLIFDNGSNPRLSVNRFYLSPMTGLYKLRDLRKTYEKL